MRIEAIAIALVLTLGAGAARAHPPSATRKLLVEADPRVGRIVLVHLVLSGVHRHAAIDLLAGPPLAEGDDPLVRAVAPRALDGIRLSDAAGRIDLSKGKASAKRGQGRIELMILLRLGDRGQDGLEVALDPDAEPLEVGVVGARRTRALRGGEALSLSLPALEPAGAGDEQGERR